MPDFSHSLRDAIEADARAHLGAEALPGTRRTIVRRRRVTAAGYGAGSALAVGGLAVGGVLLASREDPAPASGMSPTPSPSSEAPIAYATIDLNDYASLEIGTSLERELCGQPAPAPTSQDGEFSATFEMLAGSTLEQADTADLSAIATSTVLSSVDGKLPAFASGLEGLVIRDDIIVGLLPSGGEGGWRMFAEGGEINASLDWWGHVVSCDRESEETLPGGAYELMLTIGVTASEREAALFAVQRAGLQLYGDEASDALVPGGYECERFRDSERPLILNCDVTALPGTSIDREAGTITIPYESSLFDREVDARMYSEPIPITLTDYVEEHQEEREQAGPDLTAGVVPACGQSYGGIDMAEVVLESRTTMGNLEVGDTFTPRVWRFTGTPWEEASVALPATPRAWLLRRDLLPLDDGSAVEALRVVGWVDLAAQDGTHVDITRYDGPEPWPLEVTDVTWCDGDADAYVSSMRTATVIIAEHTVTDETGSRTSSDPITLSEAW